MMSFEDDIKTCTEILQKGGTILYPTDTVWGLGCDATNEEAVAKIFSLKQRNEKKSLIILLDDENEIQRYAKKPTADILKILSASERPVTVIYPDAKNLAANLINDDGTIAIRIVNDPFCQLLIRSFGKPIVSTSANISREPFPQNFKMITDEIKDGTDYIVKHRRDENVISSPSKIIKWENNKEITVIRE